MEDISAYGVASLGLGLLFLYFLFWDIKDLISYYKQDEEERNDPMMYCYSCDAVISKRARFCPECGHTYSEIHWEQYSSRAIIHNIVFNSIVSGFFIIGAMFV
ncbi:putative RNA-binding Zn-ribbon protein involved in translation (DUF1610 family) [Paenibacillus turicensis]|uniref:RNA-binding Zn-ribbon protein involved in translation (DUF1610 family) n=1 Tax=Paenibacillus turicensis TaxID=160487 RepID=A0ABS4FW91_9BACL|nr:hypothetical protein [Paenibacillus turicensis]MBP1906789.1 putative RNA-binding Zn-ribbon protein involved in translation (DUF1610 family) [Paenibacillus turicensis]